MAISHAYWSFRLLFSIGTFGPAPVAAISMRVVELMLNGVNLASGVRSFDRRAAAPTDFASVAESR
jgi:hypothetical protein